MTFISYAQNFEDVMLWRALKHIVGGFYIDVGAWSPDADSVTRAFYERGWQGINVEPNSKFHARLAERRTRDMNLRIAVSDKAGLLTMNFLSNPGLSTLDEDIAQRHALAGLTIDKQDVDVINLATLWKQHVPVEQSVHFLKVDVEGLEDAVLRGNDWSKYRPWVVVVEATLPMSQQESHDTWEPILLNADYRFAYSDGLNRFYVADEHAELLPAFKYPPNVFDDFKLDSQQQAEDRAQEAQSSAQEAQARAQEAQTRAYALDRELKATYASCCWRITFPLRAAFNAFLWSRAILPDIPQIVKQGIGGQLNPLLDRLIYFTRGNPRLKAWALAWVRRYPLLETGMYRFLAAKCIISGNKPVRFSSKVFYKPSTELSKLTPGARCIYTDLKDAIEQHNKGV